MEEVMEKMTAGKQGAQLFKQELLSKGRHEKNTHPPTEAHLNIHTHVLMDTHMHP